MTVIPRQIRSDYCDLILYQLMFADFVREAVKTTVIYYEADSLHTSRNLFIYISSHRLAFIEGQVSMSHVSYCRLMEPDGGSMF